LVVRWVLGYRRSRVVSPAQHLLADLEECFPGRVLRARVISNGTPEPVTRSQGQREGVAFYARGGGFEGDVHFWDLVGRLPEVKFTTMGRQTTETANVKSMGWVTDPYKVLENAYVLLNTSRTEGSPNTALQAIAVGSYVVGAANAGMRELRDRYPKHVLLYDYGDMSGAAQVLREVLDSPAPGIGEVPTNSEVTEEWVMWLVTK
jgi:glycosyltransferase involved in cell wall biosynthesis